MLIIFYFFFVILLFKYPLVGTNARSNTDSIRLSFELLFVFFHIYLIGVLFASIQTILFVLNRMFETRRRLLNIRY